MAEWCEHRKIFKVCLAIFQLCVKGLLLRCVFKVIFILFLLFLHVVPNLTVI